MSDRLRQVFEKHSSMYEDVDEPVMSADQFEAAVKELMPSDEEIGKNSMIAYPRLEDAAQRAGYQNGQLHFRSHILGTDKKEG